MPQSLLFDSRYSFDFFTQLPLDQAVPFQSGDQLLVPVLFLPHPVHEAIREEISPDLIWYASVYPFGQPEPSNPLQDTIWIELVASHAPEKTWSFPWQIDPDKILISYLEEETSRLRLPLAVDETQNLAMLSMELTTLESLEIDPEKEVQLWRIILKPAGKMQRQRIVAEVHWLPPISPN